MSVAKPRPIKVISHANQKDTGSPMSQSNLLLTRGAEKRVWVVRERVTIGLGFTWVLLPIGWKKSSEPIKLKVSGCLTDAKRGKTCARQQGFKKKLFHAIFKKVTIGFVFNFDWLVRKLREFLTLSLHPDKTLLVSILYIKNTDKA